ncbi:MAG: membrane protein insertion efficiency factor YidD [Alphaproteobacteria bacterium]|nr:membrane protein insertion efficiency factor YidD [Alphaproteobacteria bacterium]
MPKSKLLTIAEYVIATVMIGAIQLYRWTLSPIIGRFCRFQPTCSVYTIEAIKIHGPWAGGVLGIKRICRCHPAGGFGFDPVPPRDKNARPHTREVTTDE